MPALKKRAHIIPAHLSPLEIASPGFTAGKTADRLNFMETEMNSVSNLLKGGLVSGCLTVAATTSSLAADVDFSRYFKSAAALSAVASAVSILEPCEKAIEFSEKVEGDSVTLTAVCPASDGEAITVNVEFQKDETGTLFPDSFDYGG